MEIFFFLFFLTINVLGVKTSFHRAALECSVFTFTFRWEVAADVIGLLVCPLLLMLLMASKRFRPLLFLGIGSLYYS